jgi:hypothetical protein
MLLDASLEQNYIQFNDEYYKQNDGLAMGTPTSALLAEVFIQHLEHKIIDILKKHHIIDYYRYVDDILIIYNTRTTNINDTLTEFNALHPKIHFTIETEMNSMLNYLDLTITNRENKLTYGIYRKPTTTDLILHNDSSPL